MLKLVEKYSDRPVGELPLLFQRILQNAIHDHFRRQKVRSFWTTLFSSLDSSDDADEHDLLETLHSPDGVGPATPEETLHESQILKLIESALETLPARQREAFLLRYWEELDTAETAQVMGCSEGSVKTHCSRATHALAEILQRQGVTLK